MKKNKAAETIMAFIGDIEEILKSEEHKLTMESKNKLEAILYNKYIELSRLISAPSYDFSEIDSKKKNK